MSNKKLKQYESIKKIKALIGEEKLILQDAGNEYVVQTMYSSTVKKMDKIEGVTTKIVMPSLTGNVTTYLVWDKEKDIRFVLEHYTA